MRKFSYLGNNVSSGHCNISIDILLRFLEYSIASHLMGTSNTFYSNFVFNLLLLPVLFRSLFSISRRMEPSSQCVFTPLWYLCSMMKPFRWRICAEPWRIVWSKLLSLQNTWMRKLFITFNLADVLLLEGLRFVLYYFGAFISLPLSLGVCLKRNARLFGMSALEC